MDKSCPEVIDSCEDCICFNCEEYCTACGKEDCYPEEINKEK